VCHGLDRVRAGLYYRFCLAIKYLVGLNVYDAILLVARKEHQIPEDTPDR